jgi:hypothetical protein
MVTCPVRQSHCRFLHETPVRIVAQVGQDPATGRLRDCAGLLGDECSPLTDRASFVSELVNGPDGVRLALGTRLFVTVQIEIHLGLAVGAETVGVETSTALDLFL